MNAQHFPVILRAHKRLVAICIALGLVLGILAALLKGTMYEAETEVLATVKNPESVQDAGIQPQLSPDYLSTQVDIIRSERVARRVADRLELTSSPEAMEGYRASGAETDPLSYFASTLQKHLTVVPSIESRVISIRYAAPNPVSASSVANAFAQAYQDISLDLQVAPARQSAEWFDRNAADLRKQLADAQSRLTARQQELGVTSTLEQIDAEEARLSALTQALAAAQAEQAAARARTGGGALPDKMINPVVQGLDADIARLEAQRAELATRVGPNHVELREVNSQIAALRNQRAQSASRVAAAASTSAGQAMSNVRQLEGDVASQKARVIRSRSARGDVAALQQDVNAIRLAYDELIQRKSQAKLAGSGEQTNVSILSPATPPLRPSGLPGLAFVIAGLFFGLLIGVILAIVRELLDQRIRRPEDTELWLGLPNLGPIHALAGPGQGRIGHSRRYLPPQ